MDGSQIVGIVGGTGVYDLEGLTETEWRTVASPFGAPSDQLLFGRLGPHRIVFLPRHGRGHRIPPHEINFLANVDALKRAGATALVSVSAVGSLREDLPPGTFVVVDQFVDRTLRGPRTFFGTGLVAHVSMASPTCARVGDALLAAGAELGLAMRRGGTYLAMEGPQFSTRAESEVHRGMGCDVVGMTNLPEARLAREAELCYATVAMVTDYDCWHDDHGAVSVADVIRVMHGNSAAARRLLRAVVPLLGAHAGRCPHGCDRALDTAIVTAPAARDAAVCARLDAVAGRALAAGSKS